MKRLHIHVGVHDLHQSLQFYSTLFGAEPLVKKDDFAKWILDDPRMSFAISTLVKKSGVDHLGIQVEGGVELEELAGRLAQAEVSAQPQKQVSCCYAKSDKYWTVDPQGVAWESFHTLGATAEGGLAPRPASKKADCCG